MFHLLNNGSKVAMAEKIMDMPTMTKKFNGPNDSRLALEMALATRLLISVQPMIEKTVERIVDVTEMQNDSEAKILKMSIFLPPKQRIIPISLFLYSMDEAMKVMCSRMANAPIKAPHMMKMK